MSDGEGKGVASALQSPVVKACEKCGGEDIHMSYHAAGCGDPKCSCTRCSYGSHNKRRDEHLHRFCRGCQFDWTSDIVGGGVPDD